MSTVQLDKKFALELIDTNLSVIKKEIESILEKWNEESAQEMVEKTRRGEVPEAEMDAISLTNLLDKQKSIEKVLVSIGEY